MRARGRMRVAHGTGVLSRLVATLLRLPRASAAAELQLTIARGADGVERWTRTFDGVVVSTEQHTAGPGVIAERFGPLEFTFRVEPENGAERYRQTNARLSVLGRVYLPLPVVLAPRIDGLEQPTGPGAFSVQVRVTWPPAGLILQYDGDVHIEDHR